MMYFPLLFINGGNPPRIDGYSTPLQTIYYWIIVFMQYTAVRKTHDFIAELTVFSITRLYSAMPALI